MLVNILSVLANLAPSDKLLYIDSKIWPPHTRKKCRHSLSYTQMCCITRIMHILQQKLTQATRPRNHKLIYIRSWCTIAQLQPMNFTKTEVPIITICLPNDFSHGCVALVLLALVDCSKPARFYGKRRQPCSMPTGPQLSCSLVRKSMRNLTPILWHLNNT